MTVQYPQRGNGHAPKVPLSLFQITTKEDSCLTVYVLEKHLMKKVLNTRFFKRDGIQFEEDYVVSLTCVF